MAENQTKQSAKERLKEITDSIEVGIKEMYESDKYAQYLRTMSRFHRYSVNNTMLIAMQRPDSTQVAGFNKWRDSFKRTVKKGEKGIKIIAPTPYKVTEQQMKIDPQTKAPILDANGKVQTEEVEKQIPMFRVVSVFDVSQTYGEPLPTLASDLTGNVEQYEIFMEAVKRSAPVSIAFEKMPEDTDGYYHTEDKRIAIREDMSEVQTVSATIHEVAHSLLHDRQSKQEQQAQQDETATPPPQIDRRTEEVQAESISFAVCSYYGIETGDNSFGYIANWSKGKELPELKDSLEVINKTSSQLITDIDRHFAEIVKERGIDLTEQTPEFGELAQQSKALSADDGEDIYADKGHITEDGYNISIDGHIGTWYVVDTEVIEDKQYFFLEHEEHGDNAACLIVDGDGNIALDDVWNGFGDLREHSQAQLDGQGDYLMPDPNVTPQDAADYGYTAEELLPLTKERAFELWSEDLAIYALYPDNTEAAIFDLAELDSHAGYFGIEKEDWEHSHIFTAWKSALPHKAEKDFLSAEKDSFGFAELQNFGRDKPLDTVEKSIEQNYNMIDSQINNEPIVGKIDYLGTNGEVVETVEYTDKDRFAKQVKEDNYYGVPMTVTTYGETALEVESFDPPPQGFTVEKKSVLADLKSIPPQESKKEKTAPSKGAETER